MKTSELIRWSLTMTHQGFGAMIADMNDAALVQPTPGAGNGGNHTLWSVGHQAFIEANVHAAMLGGENALQHWAPLFAPGSQPSTDASKYPPFDEVVRVYGELRARSLRLLEEIGEEGLGHKPKAIPPGFEQAMPTLGHALMLITLHQMVHYGEIADARRVAGRKPLQ